MVSHRNYIQIQGWMISDLGLKGNELLCYALIYGFSQDDTSEFSGSTRYIAEWLNISKRTALELLKTLVQKGLLTKRDVMVKGVRYCRYAAITDPGEEIAPPGEKTSPPYEEIAPPPVKKLHRGGEETSPNNTRDNTREIILEDNSSYYSEPNGSVSCTDVQRVVDAWNSVGLQTVKKIVSGTQRDKWLKKRIQDYGLEMVLEAVENVRSSSFLMGRNKKGWQATFDWFLRPNNFPKVLDGNYADKTVVHPDMASAHGAGSPRPSASSEAMDALNQIHQMFEAEERRR